MLNEMFSQTQSAWERTTLGEVCDRVQGIIQTGPFGSQLHASDYVSDANGIPSIMPVNIGDGIINPNEIKRVKEEDAVRLARHRVLPGDIVYSRRGDVERCALVREEERGWLCGTGCMLIRLQSQSVDARYLLYYLTQPSIKEWIVRHAVGATMPNLNTGIIRSIPLVLPSIDHQRKIASILGTLDDKIELSRRMNRTLESMAQAIFKSWFIDFDPVHRNAACKSGHGISTPRREYASIGQYSEMDSLFPDSFKESDIGPVPKGWSVEMLGGHASIARGLSYKGSGLADTGKPMFNLNSVVEGGGYKKAGIKYYTGDYFDKHEVLPGDLIVANTEQGFDRLLIGYAAVVPEYFTDGGIYSHHVYRVRPNSNSHLTARYLERWLNSPLPHDWITSYSNGTTVNMLPVDGLTNAQVLLPPREIIHAFTDIANSIAVQQQANDQASMHYSQTRDLLLQPLMLGSLAIESLGQE
jgi:type I restriction enzyme S subunit